MSAPTTPLAADTLGCAAQTHLTRSIHPQRNNGMVVNARGGGLG